MANTIVTKNSSTASAVPTAADLVQGELAVNVTDKRLFTENSGGTVVELGTNPSSLTLPNGTANGVAYLNGSKVLTSGSALTFDGSNLAVGSAAISSGTGNVTAGVVATRLPLAAHQTGTSILQYTGSVGALRVYGETGVTGALAFNLGAGGSADSEQMRLTSTGLGIGTSSPDQALVVNKASGSTYLKVSGANNVNNDLALHFTDGTNNAYFGMMRGTSGGIAGALHSYTGGAIRSTLDSSGNLGLGVTPSAWDSNVKAIQISNAGASVSAGNTTYSSSNHAFLTNNGYFDGTNWIYSRSTGAVQYRQVNSEHRWNVAPSGTAGNAISFTQAMTLDSSGNLLVGKTATSYTTDGFEYNGASKFMYLTRTSGDCANFNRKTTDGNVVRLRKDGTEVGSISVTASATAYNTSSDYRLKENVTTLTGAADRVKALKPSRFNFIADPSKTVDGFIAHEAAEVVPEAVTGTKDAVDADGNPEYQGIDQSKLVPLLTAALQEALAEIESIKARLDAANL